MEKQTKQNAKVKIVVADVRDPQAWDLDIDVMDVNEHPDKVFLVKEVLPTAMLELLTKESLINFFTNRMIESGVENILYRLEDWEEDEEGLIEDILLDLHSESSTGRNVIFVHLIKNEDADRILNTGAIQ